MRAIERARPYARPNGLPMSRRAFLRGTSGLLAVPWMPSWAQAAGLGEGAAPAEGSNAGAPVRMAFVYTPNGYNQGTFLPRTPGPDWELPRALEPLAKVKEAVTLVSGLDRRFVPGTGVHAQCGACWLTSSAPEETLDGGFPTNVTLDQLVARDARTILPSLELSCNDFADRKETKYFESVSWYGPGYAAKTEKNPREVFRRLFGNGGAGTRTRPVLDAVLDDAKRMRARLAGDDRVKLDEYLESVRATERRIELAEAASARIAAPPIEEPAGIPERRDEYLRLMGDLVVLAFQLDLTRVATLVVDPERWDSPRMFHGVFDSPQNHHVLTHTKGEEAGAMITEIDRFHVAQYAYLVERLRSVREGEGTLLDHCVIAMGSGISDGDKHDYADLQVLVAGGGGGRLKPGQFLHFRGDRPLADLWLTLGNVAGLGRERFADSTGEVKEILA